MGCFCTGLGESLLVAKLGFHLGGSGVGGGSFALVALIGKGWAMKAGSSVPRGTGCHHVQLACAFGPRASGLPAAKGFEGKWKDLI